MYQKGLEVGGMSGRGGESGRFSSLYIYPLSSLCSVVVFENCCVDDEWEKMNGKNLL